MSLKNVLVCPRPKYKAAAKNSSPGTGHRVDHSLDAGGKGANPTPQDSLAATREFYGLQPTQGGEGFAALPPKSGGSPPSPVILTDTVNLDHLERLPFTEPRTCDPKYIVLQCNCGRQIVPSTCMNRDCTICAPHVGRKRSESVFRRLMNITQYPHSHSAVDGHKQIKNRPYRVVIYTIFTIPIELREKYLDKKQWSLLRGRIWKMLKKKFGGLYGVEISHPHGDKKPTLFHPHFNFLWVQRDGWRGFIPTENLRDSFAQLVGTETVNVRTQYSKWVRQIKHWCNYTCRTFPGNHVWTGCMRWYGAYPRDVKKFDVNCPTCGCKFKRIGWIPKWLVDQFYEKDWITGIDPPWYSDKNIFLTKNRCRTTSELSTYPHDSNPV